MKELAGAYIEKRIQIARTKGIALGLASLPDLVALQTDIPREDLARYYAEMGAPFLTASHLHATSLHVSEKGKILAEAYQRSVEGSVDLATYYTVSSRRERDLKRAQRSNKIAQGLTRAVERARSL